MLYGFDGEDANDELTIAEGEILTVLNPVGELITNYVVLFFTLVCEMSFFKTWD